MMTFIQKCVKGLAKVDEVDDYVEEWHFGHFDISLSEFLGMTDEEYGRWMVNGSILSDIIAEHSYYDFT